MWQVQGHFPVPVSCEGRGVTVTRVRVVRQHEYSQALEHDMLVDNNNGANINVYMSSRTSEMLTQRQVLEVEGGSYMCAVARSK